MLVLRTFRCKRIQRHRASTSRDRRRPRRSQRQQSEQHHHRITIAHAMHRCAAAPTICPADASEQLTEGTAATTERNHTSHDQRSNRASDQSSAVPNQDSTCRVATMEPHILAAIFDADFTSGILRRGQRFRSCVRKRVSPERRATWPFTRPVSLTNTVYQIPARPLGAALLLSSDLVLLRELCLTRYSPDAAHRARILELLKGGSSIGVAEVIDEAELRHFHFIDENA